VDYFLEDDRSKLLILLSGHHLSVCKLSEDYFKTENQLEQDVPSLNFASGHLYMSFSYPGDLLKKETGRNASDLIYAYC
jgi:hypothetical protein